MGSLKQLYVRTDTWLQELSGAPYAAFIGIAAGLGWLIVGLLLGAEFPYVTAVTVAFVMFTLEYATGNWRTSPE